jgi:hypothetical protein
MIAAVRSSVPSAISPPCVEVQQHLPVILERLANVMESAGIAALEEVITNVSNPQEIKNG